MEKNYLKKLSLILVTTLFAQSVYAMDNKKSLLEQEFSGRKMVFVAVGSHEDNDDNLPNEKFPGIKKLSLLSRLRTLEARCITNHTLFQVIGGGLTFLHAEIKNSRKAYEFKRVDEGLTLLQEFTEVTSKPAEDGSMKRVELLMERFNKYVSNF